jgi:hypothetical protein
MTCELGCGREATALVDWPARPAGQRAVLVCEACASSTRALAGVLEHLTAVQTLPRPGAAA